MPRIMPWKSVSTARRSRSESDEQPKASTTHSMPLMPASPLSLRLPAFRAEFAGARDRLAALAAELCCRTGSRAGSGRCRASASWAGGRRLLDSVHHRLAHGDASAEPCANANGTATFVARCDWNRLRHLVLRELAHFAEHVHADALVEHFLQLFRKREIFDNKGIESEAVVGKRRL